MGIPQAPCQGCPDRHENCWPSCSKFQSYNKKKDKYKENIRNGKRAEEDWGKVRFGSKRSGIL